MTHRLLIVFALLALAPLAARADPPNVVVIVADDLGWADVGYHGSPIQTPHLDALVARGVELDRFYAQPICGPTRVSLMTARVPQRSGLMGNIEPGEPGLPTDASLMPEAFQAAGYQTWLLGKWHLGNTRPEDLPNQRGFDHFFGFHGGGSSYFLDTRRRRARQAWSRNGEPVWFETYTTDALADEAVALIESRDADRPVFLMLSFNAVHTPLQATEAALARYADVADEDLRAYRAMASSMDDAIGRVLAALEAQGLTRDTLVLFFSDNGGASRAGPNGDAGLGDNTPLRGGKGTVYEGGVRTAATVCWPGVLEPGVSQQVVSVYDVFPTLASAAGIDLPAGVEPDGVDLWPALRDGEVVDRPAFVLGSRTLAVIDGPWKLVWTPRGQTRELFRLNDDPHESNDLAADHADVVERLSEAAQAIRSLTAGAGRGGERRDRAGRGGR